MMILCRHVSFAYENDHPVLDRINFNLSPGFTLLLGPNGCGKSTLLRLLAGIEMPDSGTIAINGLDLWQDEAAARKQLIYYPEYPDLTPYAAIDDILGLVCRLRGEPVSIVPEILKDTGLERLSQYSVRELSNGQRRRILFAACRIGRAPVVLFDEPLEGLDTAMQKKITLFLQDRKRNSATVLLATHNIGPFLPLADQALFLAAGGITHHRRLPNTGGEKLRFLEKMAEGDMPAG